MKQIYCKKCGDEIQNGYKINPTTSRFCENCAEEMKPCKRSKVLANDCECDRCIDRAESDADLLRGN